MRLKPSLKNSVNPALLFSLLLLLNGCVGEIQPTYKEEDIPNIVKQICKNEYNLEVTTKRTHTTLWIYAPVNSILNKDKELDENLMEKMRNILTTVGRVLISSDDTPEFFALLASDIKKGKDFTLIGNVLDIKKSYATAIPWTETNRRYVMKFKEDVPEAIGDTTGEHLNAYDIKLPDFLSEQMAQRVSRRFQDEELKNYFAIESLAGVFNKDTIILGYAIKEVAQPKKKIDIKEEILNIIAYCIKTYEFRDFSLLKLVDLSKHDTLILNKASILARPIE